LVIQTVGLHGVAQLLQQRIPVACHEINPANLALLQRLIGKGRIAQQIGMAA
jgi:hypothetical protein